MPWPCSAWLGWPCRASAGPGALHPLAHGGAGLARRGAHQLLGGQGGHLHVQVDAVEQRAAELALVARHLVGACSGRPAGSTRGSHRGTDSWPQSTGTGPEFCPLRRAGDGDVAGFERLAQASSAARGIRGVRPKQHALVGERDFAGAGWRSAAHQRHGAGRVGAGAWGGGPSLPGGSCRPGWPRRRFPAPRPLAWRATARQSAAPAWTCPSPAGPPSRGHGRQQRQSPARGAQPSGPSHRPGPARRWGCAVAVPAAPPSLRWGRGARRPGGRKACTTSSRWRARTTRAPGTRAASSALPRGQHQAGGAACVCSARLVARAPRTGAARRTGTARPQIHAPPAGWHRSAHWRRGCPAQSAGRTARNPWADRRAPGSR